MHNLTAHTFLALAEVAQSISESRERNAKIELCTHYFQLLDSENDLQLAAQYLGEGAFPGVSGKRISLGSRTYSTLAAEMCEIDYEEVFKPSKKALGNATETIEKLWANVPEAQAKWSAKNLSLMTVSDLYKELQAASTRIEKQRILAKAWLQMTPLEVKYFLRIMGRSSLRIGLKPEIIESAIAEAFGHRAAEIHYVHMITGSIGETAVLAKNNRLDKACFTLFQPIPFMLTSAVQSKTVEDYSLFVVEEKLDGMRCQLHVLGEKVKIYSRDLSDITSSFPEIVDTFSKKKLPKTVLDGEICIFKDHKILPSQFLQKRIGQKKLSNKSVKELPAIFIAFDVIHYNGDSQFGRQLLERRALLLKLAEQYNIPVTTQQDFKHQEHIETLFNRALAHGSDGLILKHKESNYEYGQLKRPWLKIKKPLDYLITILMYAHAKNRKRGGSYSHYTLGVSVQNDERFEEEFIPIAKAFEGFTHNELERMNERIKEIVAEKYGPTLGLYPEIVIELEFDDIQVNKRTKANYTLRSPRFKAIRWELSSGDVDTLKEVEKRYQEKIEQERLTQHQYPSFFWPRPDSS